LSDPSTHGRSDAPSRIDRSASGDDLVRRAAAGDVEAFEMLYRENVGRVHALCLRMARDRTEADELTQETFVRVWERLGSFRGDSAFTTWLHRVTVNVVIAGLRTRGRWRERFAAAEAEDFGAAVPAFSAGGDLDLERAIARLSPQARLVFLLHDVEGYQHGEIAELTGLAVGTSKAHLHRARQLLRQDLSR
jgi:RNA polymerase sigma-70 factor, ECF subfamily